MKNILYFLEYIFYFLITIERRNEYMIAKSKGMDCIKSKNDLFGTTYTFNRSKKPERRYTTWREFWAIKKLHTNKVRQ